MANYVLRKTVLDNRQDVAFSVDRIKSVEKNFYMGDLLKSVCDETTAVQMFREMTLARGGFRLTKWISFSREVLSQIPPQEKASPSVDLNFDELPIERTLCLKWNTEKDCFRFLGVLDPYMLAAKCLIQSLWRKNKDWDEPLDEGDQSVWKDWLEDLMRLSELELPRCFCVKSQCRNISRITNQFRKIEFWFIPPKQPFDMVISENDIKKSPSALHLDNFRKVRKFPKKYNFYS